MGQGDKLATLPGHKAQPILRWWDYEWRFPEGPSYETDSLSFLSLELMKYWSSGYNWMP